METNISRDSAWILTCESWLEQDAYVILKVNPENLDLHFGIRTSNEIARASQTMYYWRSYDLKSDSGTLIHKPTIQLNINSGNVIPSFDPSYILAAQDLTLAREETTRALWLSTQNGIDSVIAEAVQQYNNDLQSYMSMLPNPENAKDYLMDKNIRSILGDIPPHPSLSDKNVFRYSEQYKKIPLGVQNLYALYSLIDERRIFKQDDKQIENRAMLVISTLAFPRLTLFGFFTEAGLDYTADAENPGMFDMSLEFVVTETVPKLQAGQWNALAENYLSNIGTSASTVEHAQQFKKATKANTPPEPRDSEYTELL